MIDRRIGRGLVAALATGALGAGALLLGTVVPGHPTTKFTSALHTPPATVDSTRTTSSRPKECTKPKSETSRRHGGSTYGSYYVTNNMWNPLSVRQTLYSCNYDSWYVDATMTSQGGAVQTYPNSQMTFEQRPRLSTLKSLFSSFAESTRPSGNGYDYEYAYDIWINGYGGAGTTEVMVWNYVDGQTPGGTLQGTLSYGGHTYDVYLNGTASAGDYVAFVSTSNFTSGTLDLVDFFRVAISQGWIERGSAAELWQVDYGVEICSTNGHAAKFDFTDFAVTPVYR